MPTLCGYISVKVDDGIKIIITNQQRLAELSIRVTVSLSAQIHIASLLGHNLNLPAIAGFLPPPLISVAVIDCRLASSSDSMLVTEHLLFISQILTVSPAK